VAECQGAAVAGKVDEDVPAPVAQGAAVAGNGASDEFIAQGALVTGTSLAAASVFSSDSAFL